MTDTLTNTQPTTSSTTCDLTDLTDLRGRVAGPVLAGTDPAVPDEVATFNLATTHRPTVVVGATGPADVAAAVSWAVAHDLPVAVQATGHGPVQAVQQALMITTTRMRYVEVDPAARTATVGAGVRWGEVIAAAAPYGLAGVSGSSSQVGVVGYCVGGGMGALSRQYGFGADQVLGIELVTADGEIRWLDETSEPDLFWAVRGGKGNFGVVTSLRIALVPVATIYGGAVFFAGESAHDVLHSFRTWAPTLPDRATTSLALLNLPPAPHLPEQLRGRYVVMLRFAHNGTATEGAELLAPMLEAGEVLVDGVAAMPYANADSIHQDPVDPMPVWEKSRLLADLTADGVDTLLTVAGPQTGAPLAMVELRLMGGALGRQPRVPNAVSGREGAYSLFVLGVLAPEIAGVVPAAGLGVLDAMAPWATGTTLVNWLGDAGPAEVARAWRPDVHARLMQVKQAVDPANVFRFGHALV
jgi:FAD/FMN-containing dehydrogenase